MDTKYFSFRRWLYTPIIIWQGDWIPKASSHSGFSLDNLNNNLTSIDQQTDYEIPFIVHRDSRCQRLCSSKSSLYSLGTNDMSWCYRMEDVEPFKHLDPESAAPSKVHCSRCFEKLHPPEPEQKQVRGSKRPFLTLHSSLNNSIYCYWKQIETLFT